MERIYATDGKTVDQIGRVAVAVYRDGSHIGLIHRSAPPTTETPHFHLRQFRSRSIITTAQCRLNENPGRSTGRRLGRDR
jgi:hypothetical protein